MQKKLIKYIKALCQLFRVLRIEPSRYVHIYSSYHIRTAQRDEVIKINPRIVYVLTVLVVVEKITYKQ